MFRNTYQSGFLSVFYAIGWKPLKIWCQRTENGYIKRITDSDLRSSTLEICGTNVSTTYIATPTCPYTSLGIRFPFLVMNVKNLRRPFTFEIEVLDDQNIRRRFRSSTFQKTTRIGTFNCNMPLLLTSGWNQLQLNLCDFTHRIFGTTYVETTRIQIHANCSLRRVYFCDRLYNPEELPQEYKTVVPPVDVKKKPGRHMND